MLCLGHLLGCSKSSAGAVAPIFQLNGSITPIIGTGSSTFARASVAKYFDSSGLQQEASANTARIEDSKILIEGQSTNLLTHSEEINHLTTNWAQLRINFVVDDISAIDGNLTADKVTPNGVNGQHYFFQDSSVTSGNYYTLTIVAKANGYNYLQIATSTGFASRYQNYNLSTGTLASGDPLFDVSIKSLTGVNAGWVECRLTAQATSTSGAARFFIGIAPTDITRIQAFTGDTTSGMHVSEVRFEQKRYLTTAIETTTTSATRNADDLSYPSASNFNDSEGSIFLEFTPRAAEAAATQVLLGVDSAGAALPLYIDTDGKIKTTDGTNTVASTATLTNDTQVKMVVAWEGSTIRLTVNGTTTSGSFTGTWSPDAIYIGSNNGSNHAYGLFGIVDSYDIALTQAEAEAMT